MFNLRQRHLPSVLVAAVLLAGCYNLPPRGPDKAVVLNAAAEVVEERYPMSVTSSTGNYVFAVTPAGFEGGARTKRRISVWVRQNYTGAFEPVVRVQHDLDVSTPAVQHVDAAEPFRASPFGKEHWRSMGYLVYEEEDLTKAILERISAAEL